MEFYLLLALGVSIAYNLVQGIMLYRMSQWHREDKAPF